MAPANEKCAPLFEEEFQGQGIKSKLRESRRKVGHLIILNMLVCPLLFTVIMVSLWIELGYPKVNASLICYVTRTLHGTSVVASLLLWIVSHLADIFLLVSISTDNVSYCRLYGSTVGPVLEITTIFLFTVMMKSSLQISSTYTTAKFIIITCSTVALIATFFNYYIISLAKHFSLLTRSKLMKYKITQAV